MVEEFLDDLRRNENDLLIFISKNRADFRGGVFRDESSQLHNRDNVTVTL